MTFSETLSRVIGKVRGFLSSQPTKDAAHKIEGALKSEPSKKVGRTVYRSASGALAATRRSFENSELSEATDGTPDKADGPFNSATNDRIKAATVSVVRAAQSALERARAALVNAQDRDISTAALSRVDGALGHLDKTVGGRPAPNPPTTESPSDGSAKPPA